VKRVPSSDESIDDPPEKEQMHQHNCRVNGNAGSSRASEHHPDLILERVVVHQIRPGGRRALEVQTFQIDSFRVCANMLQCFEDGLVYRVLDMRERKCDLGGEARQRVLAAKPDQVNLSTTTTRRTPRLLGIPS
jgi:hypothetical protein